MGKSGSCCGIKENIRESDIGKNVKIVRGWIGKKKLWHFWANHWSVVLELSNGQYVCLQKNTDSSVVLQVRNCLRSAAILTWGKSGKDVRLASYGECCYPWDRLYDSIDITDSYFLFFDDCQNFARKIINQVFDKGVGWFPLAVGGIRFNNIP